MKHGPIGNLHEQEANSVIAEWLNWAGRGWQADAERTGALIGNNDRPDIIIRQGDRMPVIIECEWGRPAVRDAYKRLGHRLKTEGPSAIREVYRRMGTRLQSEGRPFTEVIAVGIDHICRGDTRAGFRQCLENNEGIFTIQLMTDPLATNKKASGQTPPLLPLPPT